MAVDYRGMTLTCAGCRVELVEIDVRGEPALGCPRCDGHWLHGTALGALVARSAPGKSLESLVEFEDGTARHPCPVCGEEMESVWLELLRFERCAAHGFWCERAPLGRLLAGPAEPHLPAGVMPRGRWS